MPESYRWDGTLPADAATVWDALTRRTAAWQWQVDYEPRLGGTERGLTPDGGVVTAWQPGLHFRTRAENTSGWFNEIDVRLEAAGDRTHLRWTHTTPDIADADAYEQCAAHTDFYLRSLGAYTRWYAGRPAQGREIEVAGDFREVCALVKDRGEVFYTAPGFLGLRAEHSITRVFGRDAWGGPVGVSVHVFDGSGTEWLDELKAVSG